MIVIVSRPAANAAKLTAAATEAVCASEPCSSSFQEDVHGARWVRRRRSRWLSEHLQGPSVLFHKQKDRLGGERAVASHGDFYTGEEEPTLVDLHAIARRNTEVGGARSTPGKGC